MPAILTHHLFGRSVLEDASVLLGMRTTDEHDAFLLGCQGPDPLFYLVIDVLMRKWSPLGNAMHEGSSAELLHAMREAAERLEGRERRAGRAYVAGFACHWLLDSTVHPFVYHWQNGICSAGVPGLDESAASRVHAEIERDLDEATLFSLTGMTVERWLPHEHALKASRHVLVAIDKLYFYVALWFYGRPIDPRTFSTAAREFRFVQHVFDSPSGVKRVALSALERLVTREPFSLVRSMSHRARPEGSSDFDNRARAPWANPFTGERSEASFWDLYASARERVMPTLSELFSDGFDLAAARELTRDVNFEGAVVEPGAWPEW